MTMLVSIAESKAVKKDRKPPTLTTQTITIMYRSPNRAKAATRSSDLTELV